MVFAGRGHLHSLLVSIQVLLAMYSITTADLDVRMLVFINKSGKQKHIHLLLFSTLE